MAKAFQENAFQSHAFDEGTPSYVEGTPSYVGGSFKAGFKFRGGSRFGPEDTQRRDDKPNQHEGSKFGK